MLPLTEFKDKLHNPVLGADVGETLGIKKFEIPIPAHLAGLVKGALPAFIHKTDQERIQNLPDYFTQHRDIKFELSEKVDGTSCSYFLNNGEFGVCSRNLELKESEGNTYWKVARDIDIEAKLRTRNMNIGIQGEILGEGINGNPLKLKGHHYLVFDVWDIDHSCYLNPLACRSLCKVMELEHVPVIDPEQAVFQTRDTMEKMLDYASGKSMLNPEVEREGIVFKSSEGDISFKVVSISYLLKEKE
jgi:RNA ligase (TIGR02306 family)